MKNSAALDEMSLMQRIRAAEAAIFGDGEAGEEAEQVIDFLIAIAESGNTPAKARTAAQKILLRMRKNGVELMIKNGIDVEKQFKEYGIELPSSLRKLIDSQD